jgi:2-succinyl-6-hydroxy-2,4-cyclohexadiene-1-carboxylate synthase
MDVVALHGFAGTGRSWAAVEPGLRAPDLPGHGAAGGVRPITFASCVEHVLAAAPERFVLAGYSMGGRLALHVALAAPDRVARLVLIATTAGIEDAAERDARRRADEALAAEIERGDIDAFVARWSATPLFAGDPPEVVARWQEDMRRNEPAGLAAALRGVGTGAMAPLWDRLGELTMPAAVLAGERDAKFMALGRRLASALPGAATLTVVPGAGHGLPREAPAPVAAAIRDQGS